MTDCKAAREAGQFVPDVRSKAAGSFTAAGTQQTAYLVFVGECGASHAQSWGTKRLAVFEDNRLVTSLDVNDHGSIVGVYDVNSDGVNELLVEGGWMGQGYYGGWSSLVEVSNRRLRVLGKFGAFDDSCGAVGKHGKVEAAVIYYSRGTSVGAPEFRVDTYRARYGNDLGAVGRAAFRYVASTTKIS